MTGTEMLSRATSTGMRSQWAGLPSGVLRLVGVALMVLTIAACGGGPAPAPISMKAAASLELSLVPSVKSSTVTAEDVTGELVRTLPAAHAVPGWGAAEVSSALRWLARVVAAGHGDPTWLCSKANTNPVANDIDGRLAANLAPSRHIAGLYEKLAAGGCPAGTRFVAGGVAVGPQSWKVTGATRSTSDLFVTWSGYFGYELASRTGVPLPWVAHCQMSLWVKSAGGGTFLIDGYTNQWSSHGIPGVLPGWPAPATYLASPAHVENDPAALSAVRAAVTAWNSSQTLTYNADMALDKQSATTGKTTRSDYLVEGTVNPQLGLASLIDGYTNQTPKSKELVTDHGRSDYVQVRWSLSPWSWAPPTAPRKPAWVLSHPAGPHLDLADTSSDTNPFVMMAALASASAAQQAHCPPSIAAGATRCYALAISVFDQPANALATEVVHDGLGLGQPYWVVDIATDARGHLLAVTSQRAEHTAGMERFFGADSGDQSEIWTLHFAPSSSPLTHISLPASGTVGPADAYLSN